MLLCSGIAPATAKHRRHHPEQTPSQLSLATVAPITESSSYPLPRPQCWPSQHLEQAHLCTPDSPMFLRPVSLVVRLSFCLTEQGHPERRSPWLSNTHRVILLFNPRKPQGAGPGPCGGPASGPALPMVPRALTVWMLLSEVTLLPGRCRHLRAGGRWWSVHWLRRGQSQAAAL